MRNWKTIPIPAKMQLLEKDPRGYPVPYIIMRDKQGKPHFQINDVLKVQECISKRLCAICGQELKDDMWLVGGPLSAFHPNGGYIDSSLHQVCMEYAMQVCPYLAVTSYNNRLDASTLKKEDYGENYIFVDPTMISERPPLFVAIKISDFSVNPASGYITPAKPYLDIQYWNEGKILDRNQAVELIVKFKEDKEGGIL